MLGVPLLLLELLRLEKAGRIEGALQLAGQRAEQAPAAGEVTRLEERGADGNVAGRRLDAAFHGAHAVADFQPDVPEPADEALQSAALGFARLARQQHQQVDVRAGVHLAAAVAAGGDERRVAHRADLAPHCAHRAIDELAVSGEQLARVGPAQVGLAQRLPRGSDFAAQVGAHGGGCVPVDLVSTSKPASVTATVCSHCAERLWSLVTMVQPSASSRIPALPALIIGSMVKVMPGSSSSPAPARP